MKKTIYLLIIIVLLLTSCTKQTHNSAQPNNDLPNTEEIDNTYLESQPSYEIVNKYKIDELLLENGFKSNKFSKLIGYNSDVLYLLLCNEYNYYNVATFDRKTSKIDFISKSFNYDSISACIPVNINNGPDGKIYLFAENVNKDKTINLNILCLEINVLFNNNNLYNDAPNCVFQNNNLDSIPEVTYINNSTSNKIAFTSSHKDIANNLYTDTIYTINVLNDSIEYISSTNYSKDGDKYKGEKLISIGGTDSLYYKVANINNKPLSKAKDFKIYNSGLTDNEIIQELDTNNAYNNMPDIEDYLFSINKLSDNRNIVINQNDIFISESITNKYIKLNCLGNDKSDFYVDKEISTKDILVEDLTSIYKLNRNEFGYVYKDDGKNVIIIYGQNIKVFAEDFDNSIIKNIKTELFCPSIEIIKDTDKYIFYKETSCKSNSSANRIIWRYEKKSLDCQKLLEYIHCEGSTIDTTSEDKYICITDMFGKVIKVNTETGDLENNAIEEQKRVDNREPFYLTNIPYDKTTIYTTNPTGNLVNGGRVVADEQCIYYINAKDENKIYRIDKLGKNTEKIYDESSYRLKIYDDKIYFLRPSKNNVQYTELSSIDKDGTNLSTILVSDQINDYVIKDNFVYYIVFSGKYTEDVGYPIYHLYSLNIDTREALIIEENVSVGFNLQSVGLICADNFLYYTAMDGDYIEYNLTTQKRTPLLDCDYETNYIFYDAFIKNNDELYYEKKDDSIRNPRWELYKTNLTNNTTQKIFSKNKDTDMLMSTNVTDNYVFFIYSVADEYGNGKVYVFRVKHDGSELVKLNEIPTRHISNLPTATLYIVNDKIIIYNNCENIEGDKIIILDFDGNKLDWDI